MNRIVISLGIVISIILFSLPAWPDDPKELSETGRQKLRVSTSFSVLAHFAKIIGGDDVEVTNVTPPGVSPHDFEPPITGIKEIYDSDIFIYQGGSLDSWAEKIEKDILKADIKVLNISRDERLKGSMIQRRNYAGKLMGDPHLWLDPVIAQKMAAAIFDIFSKVDPYNKENYQRRTVSFIYQLSILNRQYTFGLKICRSRTIIVGHDAFYYMANRYGLKTIAISGLSPQDEPSTRTLGDLINAVKSSGVKYIFFEPLTSKKFTEMLAAETGSNTLVLDPIEGLPLDNENGYLNIMKDNLKNLKTALGCKN